MAKIFVLRPGVDLLRRKDRQRVNARDSLTKAKSPK
jgi:hypothetical protein